jgi:hypothetical protein
MSTTGYAYADLKQSTPTTGEVICEVSEADAGRSQVPTMPYSLTKGNAAVLVRGCLSKKNVMTSSLLEL